MPRGGYREPKGGPRAKGVGKNSQRTDAAQPIDVPNVNDSTDLTHGDRQRLEAGMRVQPIGRAASPQVVAAAPARGSPPPAAGPGAELPPHLLAKPSTRPMEDEMTPASAPPVEPQDDKEVVLQFLIDAFGDEHASKMLEEIRGSKQTLAPAPEMAMELAPEVVEEPGEPEPIELGEQPSGEVVVEEEAPVA